MDNKPTNNESATPEVIKIEGREIKPMIKDGRPNIVIGTLNIIINPARRRYHRFYKPQANQLWYLHLTVDAILVVIMVALTAFNIWLATHRPQDWIIPTVNWQKEQPSIDQEVPRLKLDLQSSKEILSPGEKFSLTINYKNEGKSTAKDAVITLDLDGEFWQGKDKIIWNSNELPRLKEIKPGESGQIKFDGVLAKKFEPQSDSQIKFALIAQVESQYVGEASATEKMTSLSNKEIIKISTELKVNAFSRYHSAEGEQLGRGPMPPVVGQATRLWVFFSSETDYNDVSDILVTAKLADNAELTGNMSATSEKGVDFDPVNRTIAWKVSRLSAPAKFYPEIGVAFEVTLTPNQAQTGQVATIISDVKASGKDVFTGKSFNLSLPDVTSLTLEAKTDGKVRVQ